LLVVAIGVTRPARDNAKLTPPLVLPLPKHVPEIVLLDPNVGLALEENALTAAELIFTGEEKVVPLEQVAVNVAGPVVIVLGIITMLEKVPEGVRFTVPNAVVLL